MSDFVSKLKLAEKAMEDIYFEKVNSELIAALHQRTEQEKAGAAPATSAAADTDKRR